MLKYSNKSSQSINKLKSIIKIKFKLLLIKSLNNLYSLLMLNYKKLKKI